MAVSGRVLAPGGGAAAGVNLDFLQGGAQIAVTNDVTDATGSYSVDVPVGTYDINYKSPAGSGWAHFKAADVVVAGPTSRPDVQLRAGVLVTGHVQWPTGAAAVAVDLDFLDPATGVKWLTLSDHSDAAGNFSVLVPAQAWDITFDPAPGDPLASTVRRAVTVAGATSLGTIVLPAAVKVSGRVVDSSSVAVVNANTIFYDAAGSIVRTVADHTDGTGLFGTYVVTGTYDIEFAPPRGTHLLSTTRRGVVISATTMLPDVVLGSGRVVTGRVVTSTGAPVAGADTDWTLPAGLVTTGSDNTGADGRFSVVVPDGTYAVGIDSPRASRAAAATFPGVVITGDTSLPDFVVPSARLVTFRVVGSGVGPLFDANTRTVDESTGIELRTPQDHSDSLGGVVLSLPPGSYEISVYPPAGSTLASARLRGVTVGSSDVALPDVVLAAGMRLSGRVVDDLGAPLAGVDLDVVDRATGLPIATPGDKTDAAGAYSVRIPAGTWDLRYTPPDALHLAASFTSVTISADTTRPDVVLDRDGDADGVATAVDVCPSVADPTQADRDADGVGDACDDCRMYADPAQTDSNGDGVGDACEFAWGDISPTGNPDGHVSILDVVKMLRLSVGLDVASEADMQRANVAPATIVAGPPDLATPTLASPRVIDVSDVVLELRVVVGLTTFTTPR